jgi:type II secretory pathway pseudopilin PulG
MVRSVDKQVRRESLERELRTVRSAIRTFRTAQDQSVMFQLERAEEKEVQLLEALADLDADPS